MRNKIPALAALLVLLSVPSLWAADPLTIDIGIAAGLGYTFGLTQPETESSTWQGEFYEYRSDNDLSWNIYGSTLISVNKHFSLGGELGFRYLSSYQSIDTYVYEDWSTSNEVRDVYSYYSQMMYFSSLALARWEEKRFYIMLGFGGVIWWDVPQFAWCASIGLMAGNDRYRFPIYIRLDQVLNVVWVYQPMPNPYTVTAGVGFYYRHKTKQL